MGNSGHAVFSWESCAKMFCRNSNFLYDILNISPKFQKFSIVNEFPKRFQSEEVHITTISYGHSTDFSVNKYKG